MRFVAVLGLFLLCAGLWADGPKEGAGKAYQEPPYIVVWEKITIITWIIGDARFDTRQEVLVPKTIPNPRAKK